MKIQTFRNMKGLVYGPDPKRIECDTEGVLKIGSAEISVSPGGDSVLPLLFHGASADFKGTFTDTKGNTYDLGKIEVRGGRITPPSPTAVEIMELRCKADVLEAENEALNREIERLGKIFDTNSLNFLIK